MDALTVIVKASALVFVVSSMLAMGLSLTVSQIIEPLKNVKMVLIALAVNFVAVPLLAIVIQAVADLDDDLYTGVILVATAAGAPFLPKLAQAAKGNIALSVGLMVMLMVVTILYMPTGPPAHPVQDVDVDAWAIAQSLIVVMLIPLAIGLFAKARWTPSLADEPPAPHVAGLERWPSCSDARRRDHPERGATSSTWSAPAGSSSRWSSCSVRWPSATSRPDRTRRPGRCSVSAPLSGTSRQPWSRLVVGLRTSRPNHSPTSS